jgi:hypothetical protein
MLMRNHGSRQEAQQFLTDQFVYGWFDPELAQQIGIEPRPDDGRGAKRPFGRRGEAVDPRRNGRLQRGGQGQIADVAAAHTRSAVAVKRATFCQLAHHLLREERITGGTLGDLVSDGADRRV